MRRKTGTVERRKNGYRIKYSGLDGKRHSETYPTRGDAEYHLAQRLAELTGGVPVTSTAATITFKELSDDVRTDYELNRYTSIEALTDRLECHILPAFGKKRASRITTAELKRYQVQRFAEGARPATVNREMEVIRRTFKLAMQGRKLFVMPHIPMLRLSNVRQGFFSRPEIEALCRHLPAPLDAFTMIAFLTGWRRGELRNLRWGNVDYARGELRLEPGVTKNRDPRTFPMFPELRALLLSLPQGKFPAQHVFLFEGKPLGRFREEWLDANFKGGLPCVLDTEGKPIKAIRIFHDLRRSAAREMVHRGIPQQVIQRLMGHRTAAMFQRYAIIDETDLRNAAALLGDSIVPPIVPKLG